MTQSPPTDRTLVMTAAVAGPGETFQHHLVRIEGAAEALRMQLSARPLRLGRHADCDVVLPDQRVSSRHCEVGLAPLDGQVVVRDLGSTNGTFVEGRRIAGTAVLAPGELLRVGSQVFRHERLSGTEAARLAEHEQDLQKARHYVESLLPAPIAEGPVRTDWHFAPSASLGGDAFGYHRLADGCFAGYLMDVSGHGVGAAMHTVSVMNVLRQRALPDTDFGQPQQVLASLNAMFQMDAHDGMYFTIWYGVYEVASRRLRYASAGHHAAYLAGADRSGLQPLRTRNLVIGAMPEVRFTAAETTVPADATLYLFSDGVFEVVARDGRQQAIDDFLPLLQQPPAPPGQEARRLYRTVCDAARPGPLDDDFTLLVVTFPS